jgi:outer membrane protein assembly factor BamB
MKPAVLALDFTTGDVIWTKVIDSHPKHGGVRGVIVDGERIICTGYVNSPEPGFLFVADDSTPAVWEVDLGGNLVKENILNGYQGTWPRSQN